MEKFKGTPGPWKKDVRTNKRNHTSIVSIIPKKYGERVIETVLTTGYIGEDDCIVAKCCKTEEHANASLIAAAPDLLEALQELVDYFKRGDYQPEFLEQAEQAIAKALTL
jgi:hypothetical protein